jgi:hypothetical protein
MHPASSTDRLFRWLLSLALSTGLYGCQKKVQDPLRLGEWVMEISEAAGLSDSAAEKPYFINIPRDSPYYEAVQSCVDWQVLSTEEAFDPEASLDRGWTAATLVRLAGIETKDTDSSIHDIQESPFAKEISSAVSRGLMKTDERHLFHPDEVISGKQAEGLLASVIAFMDEPEIEENTTEIEWEEGIAETTAQPLSIDEEKKQALFRSEDHIQEGNLFSYPSEGMRKIGKVESIAEDGRTVTFQEADLLEESKEVNLEGSANLNFDEAEVISGDGTVLQQKSGKDDAASHIQLSAFHAKQKTFQAAGFEIRLSWGNGRITAEASRQMPHGTDLYAGVKINNFHIDYKWKSRKEDVSNAYFKVKFNSEEDVGVRNGFTRKLYADLSKVKPENFVSSLAGAFAERSDQTEAAFPLAKIRVPVPGTGVLNVCLSLDLHLYATGKAEISLTQQNALGCEVRNGAMRLIRNHDNDAKAEVRGSTGATAGIKAALDLASASLMDVLLEAGAKADVSTTAHLYDREGHKTSRKMEVAADAAESAADGNPDVLVCSDIDAHWVADLKVNSGSTLLGKMGMRTSLNLLNRENAPLIPGLNHHYENGHAVDHCTRKDRHKLAETSGIRVARKICVGSYAMVVHPQSAKEIHVTGLPQGYGTEDLIFRSEDASIASVSADGSVQAVKSGSTRIHIATRDGKHEISISILVPEK